MANYEMRAWHTVLTKRVYWVSGDPDFTGANSGYTPGDLTDIVVYAVIATGEGTFNVRDFGATGDGTTNDTAAVQAAVTAAAGGVVVFPPGTYLIPTTVTVALANTTIQGMPGAILNGNGTGSTAILELQGSNCTVTGLRFVNRASASAFIAIGQAVSIENVRIRDCYFGGSGTETRAIYYPSSRSGSVKNFHISQCTFDTVVEAIAFDCADFDSVSATDCEVRDTQYAGFRFGVNDDTASPTMRRVLVRGNLLEQIGDIADTTQNHMAIMSYGWQTVVEGNVVRTVVGSEAGKVTGIYMKSYGGIVSNNYLYNASRGTDTGGNAFITIKGDNRGGGLATPQGWGVRVIGNTLINDGVDPCTGIFSSQTEAHIEGNLIDGFVGGSYYGFGITAVQNVSIVGNTITQYDGGAAIWVACSSFAGHLTRNVLIANNRIEDCVRTTVGVASAVALYVNTNTNMQNVVIEGNLVYNLQADSAINSIPFWIWQSSTYSLQNCQIRNNNVDTAGRFVVGSINDGSYISELVIADNHVENLSTTPFSASITSLTGLRIRGNDFIGANTYYTESQGVATITLGTSSVVVSHGLDTTPLGGQIQVTPAGDMTPAVRFWVDTVGASSFTLHVDTNLTGDTDFFWTVLPDQRTWAA